MAATVQIRGAGVSIHPRSTGRIAGLISIAAALAQPPADDPSGVPHMT